MSPTDPAEKNSNWPSALNPSSLQESSVAPSKRYQDFPWSIRVAQRSWLLAIAIPIFLRSVLRGKVPWMLTVVIGASAVCGLVGFLATYYSLIRYPYMGLVDAADGDLYAKHVESKSKVLFGFLKAIGLICGVVMVVGPLLDGKVDTREALFLLYVLPVVGFIGFLVFRYNRLDHPTVATFLRCSMGLGVLLFPLFIPGLILGSLRGKALLEEAELKMDSERKYVS
ncbi:MAG: hypothetical protein WCI02_00750 [Planctomycetota bacterium]